MTLNPGKRGAEHKKVSGTAIGRVGQNKMYFNWRSEIVIINDDFLTTRAIKEESIDLIVTSPPYNVDIRYGSYRDDIPYDKYLEFTRKWLSKALKLVRPDGRMCLNIPLDKSRGRKGDGFQSIYADIVNIAKKVGWKYFSTIIWNEGNISRRTAWGSWLSARAPYVIALVEVIVVFYKNRWAKNHRGLSDITKDEFVEWTQGLWTFPGENRKRIGHPAPFPLELPKRCIKLFSVEIDKKYCELAKKRLMEKAISRNPGWA